MLDRLSNSWQLAKASARVLQADKELLVFPAISGLTVILVSASFFLPLFFVGSGLETVGEGASVVAYVALFLFYLVQYGVIFFFNSALVGAALIRLDGGDPTVMDGLRIAWSRLGSILGYAAIAATVGMLLRAAKERSGTLANLVISFIGLAWSLATFLVVPILVSHRIGPVEAIKESASILKKTWGEQIAGNLGLGFFFTLAYLGLAILFVPLFFLAGAAGQGWLMATVIVVAVLSFVMLGLLNATLAGIYSAAVYRFATTGEVALFDKGLLQDAFRSR